jgi:hypothetical protein
MNRFLVYGLIGPPIGVLVIFFVLMPLLQSFTFNLIAILFFLPVAYFNGLIPALLVGLVDHFLEDRGWPLRWRVPLCALAGYIVAFAPIFIALMMHLIGGPFVLLFGVIGMFPGAICCWLADRWKKRPPKVDAVPPPEAILHSHDANPG